jgi:succinoglycan biosynthesis transport protein ExoP
MTDLFERRPFDARILGAAADLEASARRMDPARVVLGDSDSERPGFVKLIEAFRRRLWVFVLAAGAVFLLIALMTFTATRMYSATATVQIDTRGKQILPDMQAAVTGMPPDSATVDTETQIMQSRDLAGAVVDALNLVDDPEFGAPRGRGGGLLESIFGRAQQRGDAAIDRALRRERTIDNLLTRLRVQRLGVTYLVNLTVTSSNARKASTITNQYADQYLKRQLDRKYETLTTATQWLGNRLRELSEDLKDKERTVAAKRNETGQLSADGGRISEAAAAQVNVQLISARNELAAAEARLQSMENSLRSGAADAVGEALNSPVVTELRTQQATLERRKAELSTRYGPAHPEMQRIDREIIGLDRQIAAEVDRRVDLVRNERDVARAKVMSLQSSLASERQNVAVNNLSAVELAQAEREKEAARETYEGMLTRFRQLAEQSGVEQPDAKITSRAEEPAEPSSPNIRLNLILGLIAGLAIGFAAVLIVEMLEQTLRTPEDVQAKLGLTPLGALPALDRRTRTVDGELLSPENYVLKKPLSQFGEALRAMRAAVFYSSPDRQVKIVCITSAIPDEGKTTTAVGLARISALAGSKTIFVDCDLRRRAATHALGIEAECGLTELLFRTASLSDVIVKDPGSGMDVIPLAQPEFTPRDLFGTDAMRSLLDTLKGRYDVIVLDSAPVMPVSDTRMLAAAADATVFVARWGRTPAPIIRNALAQIRAHGARVAGLALQRVETSLLSRLMYDRPDYYHELYQTYYIR